MREVFVNQDHTRVGFYKSVLDEAGIPNFIRNQYSNNSLTEMPSALFFPALWVVQDEDYDQAMQILGEIYYALPSQGFHLGQGYYVTRGRGSSRRAGEKAELAGELTVDYADGTDSFKS